MKKISFKTVGITCKRSIGKDAARLIIVIKKMEKLGAKILLDEHGAACIKGYPSHTAQEICKKSTLIISLGGDGTLLRTARALPETATTPPVLSINIGRLGFLSEATLDTLDSKLKQIIAGNYKIDSRSLLTVTLNRHNTKEKPITSLALNDAVINQGSFARLLRMAIRIDKLHATSFKADGLVVATPTGSTGHSLSAGGPVVHPKVCGIVITPICPVLLSMRPIIIPDTRKIFIKIETERQDQSVRAALTIDGQETYELDYGDEVTITRAPQSLNLIRTLDRNYYKTLSDKLGWGTSPVV